MGHMLMLTGEPFATLAIIISFTNRPTTACNVAKVAVLSGRDVSTPASVYWIGFLPMDSVLVPLQVAPRA